MIRFRFAVSAVVVLLACACAGSHNRVAVEAGEYYGTLEPLAADAIYFVVTDRFVDGDPRNNFPDQGGSDETRSFDRPIQLSGLQPANIGYLGGDFRGVLNNAKYISDMGFSALWLTPIVDNPNQAFTGSTVPGEGMFADKGKSGYHGYWGVNFFKVDEHLESDDLRFADFTSRLNSEHDIKFVLDVVCNHGSPAYTMPVDQPMYGELYDASGMLVADHQNLHPNDLKPNNPLHSYYNTEPDLAELSDFDSTNPDVLDYFVAAYSHWLAQGVAAFRIDTIKHMPHRYWQSFASSMREQRADLFMFAESYSFDQAEIAEHTWPENGSISVLDFPGKQAMNAVFAGGGDYSDLLNYLHLDSRLYQNPYELMTFYDNHDMPRMDADSNGFIDANNWLFTSRGIPVVYYGSEIGFQAGKGEHAGNRNYLGQAKIDSAAHHPIHEALTSIANIRKRSIALQRGLQLNLEFGSDTATFYRVYKKDGQTQSALVLLNKADTSAHFPIHEWLGGVAWTDATSEKPIDDLLVDGRLTIGGHNVRVFLSESVPGGTGTLTRLGELQTHSRRN